MLQCRISHVACSCGAAPAVGFKPKYGAFVFQGQEWGMVGALSVLRAQRESKHHLNVASTRVPSLNLCLNRVQGLCCSCGTQEKSTQKEIGHKWLVGDFILSASWETVLTSFTFFLSCLSIHVFSRDKRRKTQDIFLEDN